MQQRCTHLYVGKDCPIPDWASLLPLTYYKLESCWVCQPLHTSLGVFPTYFAASRENSMERPAHTTLVVPNFQAVRAFGIFLPCGRPLYPFHKRAFPIVVYHPDKEVLGARVGRTTEEEVIRRNDLCAQNVPLLCFPAYFFSVFFQIRPYVVDAATHSTPL